MTDKPKAVDFYWYVWGTALFLGLTVGLFAGMSESPIATTLIAGIFGLLGGGGALGLALQSFWPKPDKKPDPLPVSVASIKGTAIALCALCGASIIGVFTGIAMRHGDLDVFGNDDDLISIVRETSGMNADQQVQLVLLQTQLALLDLPASDNNALVRSLSGQDAADRKSLSRNSVELIKVKIEDARSALAALTDAITIKEAASTRSKLQSEISDEDLATAFEKLAVAEGVVSDIEKEIGEASLPQVSAIMERISKFLEANKDVGRLAIASSRSGRSIASTDTPR
jgi:hypothetical protein